MAATALEEDGPDTLTMRALAGPHGDPRPVVVQARSDGRYDDLVTYRANRLPAAA